MTKHKYKVIWQMVGHTQSANVSLTTSSDHNASQQANKIARELGVTNTPRTISRWKDGAYSVIEVLDKGVL